MPLAILTLLSALSLAAVAGWFSIVGFMAIYAGAPMYALIMGVVTEIAKLVTTSWLYRNWEHASWRLKAPLLYFIIALMTATSIGVFGFLSKAHIEQGADKIDNSAKIESLNYQINREKSIIADNEKVIAQLDTTVNSLLGKDRADRALSVRRSQMAQRKQLQEDSAAAQKRIDELSKEKFALESEIRKLQLDVGPIRYIAELIYGVEENATKNIEAAVRIFTLLLVSTLDPLAVILLIAANHTLVRLRNEKDKKAAPPEPTGTENVAKDEPLDRKEAVKDTEKPVDTADAEETIEERNATPPEAEIHVSVPEETMGLLKEDAQDELELVPIEESTAVNKSEINEITEAALERFYTSEKRPPTSFARSPIPTKVIESQEQVTESDEDRKTVENSVQKVTTQVAVGPWAQQESVLREILGSTPHFIPKKINEEEVAAQLETEVKAGTGSTSSTDTPSAENKVKEVYKSSSSEDQTQSDSESSNQVANDRKIASAGDKYPKALSWLTEFRGPDHE